jgi:hypothetical protein
MDEKDLLDVREKVEQIHGMLSDRSLNDHDLLIRLNTISERIAADLGDVKTSVLNQLANIETRVRALEQARWMMLGAAGVLGIIGNLVMNILNHH